LSHACWLLTYTVAGGLGAALGMSATLVALALICLAGVVIGLKVWPARDPDQLAHTHTELPSDHPHLREGSRAGGRPEHVHAFVIDDLHHQWPRMGV